MGTVSNTNPDIYVRGKERMAEEWLGLALSFKRNSPLNEGKSEVKLQLLDCFLLCHLCYLPFWPNDSFLPFDIWLPVPYNESGKHSACYSRNIFSTVKKNKIQSMKMSAT